ncbi:methyltransferase domain-containing protein [Ditylenchus destructor]|uniref:Methyltransferase domain-containing protein n=1 Tax=Ditylenchus destructor TaxID=166010 RepID=A0AAD4N2I6_9BILA|nr:methyltransferase domain-containing protein [Ditylenchus destructor]
MAPDKVDFPPNPMASKMSTAETDEWEFKRLDMLALQANSDKSSKVHNYTRIYPQYFEKFTRKPIKMLEIGIFKGASVKMWENYFLNAELHFVDVNRTQILYNSTRSHYHFLDQGDSNKLKKLADEIGPFDIVVDDGGHIQEPMISSFKVLFPYVKPGGVYVFEDIHASYWKPFGGRGDREKPEAGPGTAIDFLKALIDDVNFVGASTGIGGAANITASLLKKMNYNNKHIDSIHFYNSICFVFAK